MKVYSMGLSRVLATKQTKVTMVYFFQEQNKKISKKNGK